MNKRFINNQHIYFLFLKRGYFCLCCWVGSSQRFNYYFNLLFWWVTFTSLFCVRVFYPGPVWWPRVRGPGDPAVAASWRQLAAAVSHPSACTACTAYGTLYSVMCNGASLMDYWSPSSCGATKQVEQRSNLVTAWPGTEVFSALLVTFLLIWISSCYPGHWSVECECPAASAQSPALWELRVRQSPGKCDQLPLTWEPRESWLNRMLKSEFSVTPCFVLAPVLAWIPGV